MVDEFGNIPRDIKKSQFVQQETIPAGSTFDFVINGFNYKIPVEQMIAAFGTTGTLEQLGDVTQTPVLSKSGTVNRIRNIEDGAGVKASVSPKQGIKLDHNFSTGDAGIPVLIDSAATSPVIRNLVAGLGVGIASDGDNIQISVTGLPIASNIVIVNEMTDFPSAVLGVITLADDTAYLLSAKLTTANRFILGNNTVVYGADSAVSSLEYTGVDTMFTSTGTNSKLTFTDLSCPSGKLFDISSTGEGVFQFVNVTVPSCDRLGSIANLAAMQITDCAIDEIKTAGIDFSGTSVLFVGSRNLFNITAGSVFDFGTSVFTAGWTMDTSFANLGAGTSFLTGLADSGNIAVGGLGSLLNTRFSGDGIPLDTITDRDARWYFLANDDIGDIRTDALINFSGNVTPTTINVAGTPEKIGVTWEIQAVSQFEATTDGILTYVGPKKAKLPITISITSEPVSGITKDIRFHLFRNGVDINADQGATLDSGKPMNISLIWGIEFDTDDFIELYVSNESDTVNVLVLSVVFRVN